MSLKNPNQTTLRDGRWYSILVAYPRRHQHAQWVAGEQHFTWHGNCETKAIPVGEVDEIFGEVDPEHVEPGLTGGP